MTNTRDTHTKPMQEDTLREKILLLRDKFMDAYIQNDPTPEERIKLLIDYDNNLLSLFQSEKQAWIEEMIGELKNMVAVGVEGNEAHDYKIGLRNGFNLAIDRAIQLLQGKEENKG